MKHRRTPVVRAKAARIEQAENLSIHSLRHTAITLALDAGATLRDVQDFAGSKMRAPPVVAIDPGQPRPVPGLHPGPVPVVSQLHNCRVSESLVSPLGEEENRAERCRRS